MPGRGANEGQGEQHGPRGHAGSIRQRFKSNVCDLTVLFLEIYSFEYSCTSTRHKSETFNLETCTEPEPHVPQRNEPAGETTDPARAKGRAVARRRQTPYARGRAGRAGCKGGGLPRGRLCGDTVWGGACHGDALPRADLSATRASPSCPGSRSPRRSCPRGPPARRTCPRSRSSNLRGRGSGRPQSPRTD